MLLPVSLRGSQKRLNRDSKLVVVVAEFAKTQFLQCS
jgi:hypothetical protein